MPPGTVAIAATSQCEKPDCVSAQAIAVAVPMISITAPVSDSRLDQHRIDPPPVELPIDEQPEQRGIDDADGGDLGRGRDAVDHRGADHERQRQRRDAR